MRIGCMCLKRFHRQLQTGAYVDAKDSKHVAAVSISFEGSRKPVWCCAARHKQWQHDASDDVLGERVGELQRERFLCEGLCAIYVAFVTGGSVARCTR